MSGNKEHNSTPARARGHNQQQVGPFVARLLKAQLEGLRFHELRHTAATRMAAGVSAFDIRDVLGHANIAMTQRYARPTAETNTMTSPAQDMSAP